MIRCIQNFILERPFNQEELNVAINKGRIDIAKWIAENTDFSQPNISLSSTEYSLYFYSQYVDLGFLLDGSRIDNFTNLSIIIQTSQKLADKKPLFYENYNSNCINLLASYHLLDIEQAFEKYSIENISTIKNLVENFPDICKLTPLHLKRALTTKNLIAVEYILSKGVKLEDLTPEERIESACASNNHKIVSWVLDRTPIEGINVRKLYHYGPFPAWIKKLWKDKLEELNLPYLFEEEEEVVEYALRVVDGSEEEYCMEEEEK